MEYMIIKKPKKSQQKTMLEYIKSCQRMQSFLQRAQKARADNDWESFGRHMYEAGRVDSEFAGGTPHIHRKLFETTTQTNKVIDSNRIKEIKSATTAAKLGAVIRKYAVTVNDI